MPIYAYRCATCGHAQDVLRKISDPPLDTCPACGAATFVKQVTAAGFQLKGSGWYVTDFRNNGAASAPAASPPAEGGGTAAPASTPAPAAPAAAPAVGTSAAPAAGTSSASCGGGCACH
jgi:putative FmdB family regulatory protein